MHVCTVTALMALILSLALLPAMWMSGDLPVTPIADIAAHPGIAALVFASTSSGTYRSSDGGRHWKRVSDLSLNALSFIPVHALAFNPFDDHELCALGDSAMSCTTDLGETWGEFPKPGLTFLLFDPRVMDRMFMGTAYGTDWVYVSNDHGRTWAARGSLDTHPWFHGSAAVDALTGSLLETGSPHGGCIPICSLFRSDDAGSTWREIVIEEDAWTLAADRSGRSVLYVVSGDSLRASGDLRGRIPGAVTVLVSDPNDVDVLYAGGNDGSLFRSGDGGRSWKRIDQGEIPSITHIAVGADGAVYVASDDHVFALRGGAKRRAARH